MRAFYRSRLFWLGVPGFLFLLWVWWDSGIHYSIAMWGSGKREHYVWVSTGYVGWLRGTYPPHSPGKKYFEVSREDLPMADAAPLGGRFDLAAAFFREEHPYRISGVVSMEMRMGLWLIVAGYVVVWIGAMWWWQRRKVRVMRGLTESVEEKEVSR